MNKKNKLLSIFMLASLLLNITVQCAKPIGLTNLGATCYINSVLQCLLQIDPLNQELKENGLIKYRPDTVSTQYIDFIKNISQNKNNNIFETQDFSNKAIAQIFEGNCGQQDASEFLVRLLDNLADNDLKQDYNNGARFAQLGALRENCISNLFASRINSKTSSASKAYDNNTVEPMLTLEVPTQCVAEFSSIKQYLSSLGQVNINSLSQCLDSYFREENLTGNNKLAITQLNPQGQASRVEVSDGKIKKEFVSIAPYCIIVLKRFNNIGDYKNPKLVKNYHPITIPLTNLNLGKYKNNQNQEQQEAQELFELVGIVQHTGNLISGHYTSYVKSENNWYLCNDRTISSVSSETINKIETQGYIGRVNQTPYILIYKKQS